MDILIFRVIIIIIIVIIIIIIIIIIQIFMICIFSSLELLKDMWPMWPPQISCPVSLRSSAGRHPLRILSGAPQRSSEFGPSGNGAGSSLGFSKKGHIAHLGYKACIGSRRDEKRKFGTQPQRRSQSTQSHLFKSSRMRETSRIQDSFSVAAKEKLRANVCQTLYR